ncbi:YihY family inner membrane protein [Massilia timonae]|uniref:YihY family inner membrane protein n=1 Tax=Massilia timonae TaxID=47229 RepID=UPI0028D59AC8|nr:YihY family inner membrane protein [Massilia timonae]
MANKTVTGAVSGVSRASGEFAGGGAERGLTWPEARDLVRFAVRRLREERLPQVAGSLTFTTTLALVPLLTIVLAIFTMFPAFGQVREMIDAWFVQNLMPKAIASTISGNLTQFADKAKGLSALGAVALLFTTAATMSLIERVFNQIWSVRQPRPLPQRLLVYWALLTLGPLLFGLSISFTSQLVDVTGGLERDASLLGTLFFTLASVAVTTAGYTLLYVVVPNRKVAWRDAFWGALAAAVAFEVAKRGFGLFIRQFPTYAIIYGALAALPLFLVWIYVTWMITLVGAVLTAALPVVKHERWWYQPAPGGAFVDAMSVLKVLYGSAKLSGNALVASSTIRDHTRIGYDELGRLLDRMVAEGWVGRVQDDAPARAGWRFNRGGSQENWVLLADPASLRLADVYRLFVFDCAAAEGAQREEGGPDTPLALDVGNLARQVEEAVEAGLEQTLAAHFGDPEDAVLADIAARATS